MKTSMRKVLVVSLLVGCLLVLGGYREASAQPSFGQISGTYTCTFSGTTLVSPLPFFQPNAPNSPEYLPQPGASVNVNASNGHGTWTFHNDGTGSAEISLIYSVVGVFPYWSFPPQSNSQAISFDFTYTLANDGTITTTLAPGTYVATFKLNGQDYEYESDRFNHAGMVSLDKMSITLTSNELAYATRIYSKPANYGKRYAIGHRSFVLIKVGH